MLMLDPASRWRAVKRLLFSWHPDKNPGREDFCTKVFQLIQRYVELLEQGKDLPDDDDDDVVDSGSSSNYQSYRSYSSNCSGGNRRRGRRWFGGGFFENVFSRGSDYARSRTSYYGSSQVMKFAMKVSLSFENVCG
jgi:DnaJ-class molecular chaperone